jgi:hypothetical protein
MKRWHGSATRGAGARASIAVLEGDSAPPDPAAALAPLLDAWEGTPRDGVTKVVLRFDPSPLLAPLAASGACVAVVGDGRELWALELRGPDAPPPLDLRDLEAPEPLQRILEASAALSPGAALLARAPRFPRMLLPQLERRSLYWEAFEEPDDTALVYVRRPG